MKKALTPLVSTIVLIGFAIGLGTLVMSWGNSEALIHTCSDIELEVTKLSEMQQICIQDGKINLILENNGINKITQLQIVTLTENDVYNGEIDIEILPGEFKRTNINTGVSQLLKIRLIPVLDNIPCTEKRVELENIEECE